MNNIVAIENDGTKVRFLIKNGDHFVYQNIPRGIMSVIGEQNDNTITIKLNDKLSNLAELSS
tara:strand:- start:33 stop:218 length:186 start_codon:yes stop_codon:yes gene_type:complete